MVKAQLGDIGRLGVEWMKAIQKAWPHSTPPIRTLTAAVLKLSTMIPLTAAACRLPDAANREEGLGRQQHPNEQPFFPMQP